MAQTYFPFDSGQGANVSEASWSKMAQHWLSTGVIRLVLNELQVYADSTGRQVKVKTGAAWIKGHYFNSDAEVILAISTANATNPRIDRVIVRLDWTANTIALAVLQGTAAVSPVAPSLTQNSTRWEISLAQVRVDAGVSTIVADKVTDERVFTKNSYLAQYTINTTVTLPPSVYNRLTFNQMQLNEGGMFQSATNTFKIKENGFYRFSANIFVNSQAHKSFNLEAWKIGSSDKHILISTFTINADSWNTFSGEKVVYCLAGEEFEFVAKQSSTDSRDVGGYVCRIERL